MSVHPRHAASEASSRRASAIRAAARLSANARVGPRGAKEEIALAAMGSAHAGSPSLVIPDHTHSVYLRS